WAAPLSQGCFAPGLGYGIPLGCKKRSHFYSLRGFLACKNRSRSDIAGTIRSNERVGYRHFM
ncbi:MAG: hypothetical protein QOJ65_1927, partial [Fimbriimonadaceae bacterium]|nr:hypothetical protein [Fimbriimonadaceae bacterium]